MDYNKNMVSRSQKLRKNMTKEENLLWYRFLRKYPYQFRRQYVVGNYIVDFYCHKAKLVIELDGSQHYDPREKEYDEQRTQYLNQQGLEVLRFTNLDVLRRFQSVCELIDRIVQKRAAQSNCNADG